MGRFCERCCFKVIELFVIFGNHPIASKTRFLGMDFQKAGFSSNSAPWHTHKKLGPTGSSKTRQNTVRMTRFGQGLTVILTRRGSRFVGAKNDYPWYWTCQNLANLTNLWQVSGAKIPPLIRHIGEVLTSLALDNFDNYDNLKWPKKVFIMTT